MPNDDLEARIGVEHAAHRPKPLVVGNDPVGQAATMDLLKPSSVTVRSSSSAAPLGPAAGSRKRGKPVGVAPHYLIEPVVGRRANGSAAPRQVTEARASNARGPACRLQLPPFFSSLFADIFEALHDRRHRNRVQTTGMLLHLGVGVMLLQGDYTALSASVSSAGLVDGPDLVWWS
jgi:hypothetical protein